MLVDFGHLTSLLNLLAIHLPNLSPPGWQAYVSFLEIILNFLAKGLHSAGLGIIAFTLIVKALMIPLTIQSIRSSRAMQELQPKIKELQKKYGKDRARISQETMKLYSEHHVNPMSGCLPMIIQMPIFWGVYRAIEHLSRGGGSVAASEYWTHGFLWLHNLSAADPYHILPILAGVFQFVQTKMMKPAHQGKAADSQQQMMNQMMNFMPLMVVAFGWGFSVGPVIYWTVSAAFSVGQQWWITGWGAMLDWFPFLPDLPEHKRLGYRPPRPVDDVVVMSGEQKPSRFGVMTWFQQKMEEAQQTAMERQSERTSSKSSASSGSSGKTTTRRSSYQSRVDATVEEEPKPARRNSRPRAGKNRPSARGPSGPSGESANGAANGNGAEAPPHGTAPPLVVPRKSRPTRKKTAQKTEQT